MAHGFSNRVWVDTATTGTGDVAVGSAKPAHCTPEQAGTPDGAERTWLLEEGNDFEIYRGAYNDTTKKVERGTVLLSLIDGVAGTSRMDLDGTATLRIVSAAEDMLSSVSPEVSRGQLGVDILSGFRNKIINGGFDVWQRNTSQSASGYGSDDRWQNFFGGGSLAHSRQEFTVGQTDVPGEPRYYSRSVVTHASGASNRHGKGHIIEGVRSLAGSKVTVTCYMKADSNKNCAIELYQSFGSGGSPSGSVSIPCGLFALTTSWQKISFTVDVPSIAGKTIGSDGNDGLSLIIWWEAGSSYDTRASGLGQQSGTFDLARVSIVAGDATHEDDPFSPRHIQQELALCQRYYFTTYQNSTPPGTVSANGRVWAVAHAAMNYLGGCWLLPVLMRAFPTANVYATGSGKSGYVTLDGVDKTATIGAQQDQVTVNINNSAASPNSIMTAHVTLDAEL